MHDPFEESLRDLLKSSALSTMTMLRWDAS